MTDLHDLLLTAVKRTILEYPGVLDNLRGTSRWVGEVWAYKVNAPDDDQRRMDERKLTRIMETYLAGQFERVLKEIQKDDRVKSIYDITFWMLEEEAFWEELAGAFVGILLNAVEGGILLLAGLEVNLDAVNQRIIHYARTYRDTWLHRINSTTRETVQDAVTEWLKVGDKLDTLKAVLENTFSKVRAERIAVTEVTRLYAQGNQMAWRESGMVDKFKFMTAEDDKVCPICNDYGKGDKEYPLEDLDAMIPAHVNCRCWAKPVVNIERAADDIARILRGE